MTEHPILFSGEMVRAILEGRKTQTRRVIRFRDFPDEPDIHNVWLATSLNGKTKGQQNWQDGDDVIRCPYGKVGDHLWVRETWATDRNIDNCPPSYIAKYKQIFYRADGIDEHYFKFRPSIHLPRWASRITLEIVGVRVERVRDISGSDVLAEGVDNGKSNPTMGKRWENMQRIAFQELWDSLNAKRGYGWNNNPWVWVIEFKLVDTKLSKS